MRRIASAIFGILVLISTSISQQKQEVDDEIHDELRAAREFSSAAAAALVKSFEMISNGNGAISDTAGFDVTPPPEGHGAYSADWYRDVLQGAGSVLGLPDGMQAAGGWFFVAAAPSTITNHDAAVNRWLRNGQRFPKVARNSYEIRFTQAGGKAFTRFTAASLIDVPFELWYLSSTPDETSDDVRMIPWLVDNETTGAGVDEFTFALDHDASGGENDPFSDWIYFALPANSSPGEAGYNQFVQDATGGSYTGETDEEHIARLVLMNYDRHQGESAPGAGDGPVNAMPETGTTFRLSFGAAEEGPVFVVTNTNDAGVGSLRNAISQANASANANGATPDSIKFDIPGAGPQTISLQSPLPFIADAVVLDGSTQPGASCESWPPTLAIVLDGSGAGSGNGLVLSEGGSGSAIRGLVIHSFDGQGLFLNNSDNNSIQCNFIGTDVTGTQALGNTHSAMQIRFGSSNNTVGGSSAEDRNLLSGNGFGGIGIFDSGTTGNIIQGNFIGVDVTGAISIGNDGQGISIVEGASDNIVGGATAGARNLISGNEASGVAIFNSGTTGNVVQGNLIGTDVTGAVAIGNGEPGVHIRNGASDNIVGGTTASARNVISGNASSGVSIFGSGTTRNKVTGNFIGTDVTGSSNLGNTASGVVISSGASGNTIGGATEGAGNVISGNGFRGVWLISSNNTVSGNYIGADASGTAALGNTGTGVVIESGAQLNTIGGRTEGERNLISANLGGIFIIGSNNSILGNFIGTDVTGTDV